MPSSRPSSGMPIGCAFVVGLLGLVALTSTTIQQLPSLSAPLRLELTSAKANTAQTASAIAALASPDASTQAALAAAAAPSGQPTSSAESAPNPWAAQVPAASCIPTDLPQTGRVIAVIDGETIRVLLDRDGKVYAVRYLGLDVPQEADPTAISQGVARNTELTYGQPALLVRDLTDQDSYGRLLRYVMVGRVFINYDLVAEGYARARSSPPDTSCDSAFLAAQQHAQSAALGLWASPTTLP